MDCMVRALRRVAAGRHVARADSRDVPQWWLLFYVGTAVQRRLSSRGRILLDRK